MSTNRVDAVKPNKMTVDDVLIDGAKSLGALAGGCGGGMDPMRQAGNGVGCFGFGYGIDDALYWTPWLSGTDALIRFGDIYGGGNGGYGAGVPGIPSFGGENNNNSTSSKIKNPIDAFEKMGYEKMKELAEKERKIQELKDERDKKEKAGSKEDAKTLAKQILALQDEYRKLDREVGNGSSLLKSLGGKEFNFYKNIAKGEFDQVTEMNSAIAQLKEELDELDKEAMELAKEVQEKRAELQKERNVGPWMPISDDDVKAALPEETRERIEKIEKDKKAKVDEINTKIKELKDCIKKAAKDDGEDTDLSSYRLDRRDATAKASSPKTPTQVAAKMSDKLFSSDGKLKSKSDIKSDIANSLDKDSDVTEDDIQAVLDELLADIDENTPKADVIKKLQEKDHFTTIQTKRGEHLVGNKDKVMGNRRARLLVDLYKNITDKNYKDAATEAGVDAQIVDGIMTAANAYTVPVAKTATPAKKEGQAKGPTPGSGSSGTGANQPVVSDESRAAVARLTAGNSNKQKPAAAVTPAPAVTQGTGTGTPAPAQVTPTAPAAVTPPAQAQVPPAAPAAVTPAPAVTQGTGTGTPAPAQVPSAAPAAITPPAPAQVPSAAPAAVTPPAQAQVPPAAPQAKSTKTSNNSSEQKPPSKDVSQESTNAVAILNKGIRQQ